MQLERNEFMLVVDSTNGFALYDDGETKPSGDALTVKEQIFLNVRDSISLDHLDGKWGIDAETLLNKMRNADESEYKQLWEQIEDFWDKNDRASDGE